MALTNCTINSQSFTKTGGSAIGSANAQLVITPNDGYVVSASNFTNNTGSIAGVSNITLSDSSTPGATDNTVLVDIDLDDAYIMPSTNTTLTIDIDGAADLIQYSLSGQLSSEVSNTTQSAETDVAYSVTNTAGQTSQVFQRTFSASPNHHFVVEPYFVLTSDNPSRYNITNEKTYTDGRLTGIEFTVDYTFGSESETGDTIVFTADAVEFFTQTVEIYSYNIIDSIISQEGATREINILGTPTAQVKLSVSNLAGDTYDFSSDTFTSTPTELEITIPDSGKYTDNITFPEVSSADTYTVSLNTTTYSNGINSAIDADQNGIVSFNLSQPSSTTITIGASHTDSDISISNNKVIELFTGTNLNNSEDANITHIFKISSIGAPLVLISPGPTASNFVESPTSSGTTLNITSVSLEKDNKDAILRISGTVTAVGSTDVSFIMPLDNFIVTNTKSFVYPDSKSVIFNQSDDIPLKATDEDGDALTFSIVDQPKLGTLQTSNGNVVFTDNSSTSANEVPSEIIKTVKYTNTSSGQSEDSFTYKVNDGTVDSETAKITINLINEPPSAPDKTIEVEKGQTKVEFLDIVDKNHSFSDLTYRILPPENGSATLLPNNDTAEFDDDGNIIYKKSTLVDIASFTFDYEVSDGIDTDTATITINVVSNPSSRSDEVNCNKGSDTNKITLYGSSDTVSNSDLTWVLDTAPVKGTLFYDENETLPSTSGITVGDLTSNEVYYSHNDADALPDSFKYKVRDTNYRESSISTISVNVIDQPKRGFYLQDQQGNDISYRGSNFQTLISQTHSVQTSVTGAGGAPRLKLVITEPRTIFKIRFSMANSNEQGRVSKAIVNAFSDFARTNKVTNHYKLRDPKQIYYVAPGLVTTNGKLISGTTPVKLDRDYEDIRFMDPGTYYLEQTYNALYPTQNDGTEGTMNIHYILDYPEI